MLFVRGEPSLEEKVETIDGIRRQNDLRIQRMARRISEATAAGMSDEEAFELAVQEEGLGMRQISNGERECDELECDESSTVETEVADEPWLESVPPYADDEPDIDDWENHPAVENAQLFLIELMNLDEGDATAVVFLGSACDAAMDMVGGLVQATSSRRDTRISRALAITQLKRAIHGYAFARGAVLAMRSAARIDQTMSANLLDLLEVILTSIHGLLSDAWDETSFFLTASRN